MSAKILSVDDNEIIRFLVASALKPYDCLVCEAVNGEEGLAAALREKPDLIVLDNSMPVMDGIEMLSQLRKNAEFAATPVIMLTAWSDQDHLRQTTALGIRDYLVKPFTKVQLAEKVRGCIDLALKSGVNPPMETPGTPAQRPLRPAAASVSKAAAPGKKGGVPIPDNVIRIAKLVALREVDLDEIAVIVDHDKDLRRRNHAGQRGIGPQRHRGRISSGHG
jgi:CheY-like chemotaxis protein